MEDVPNHTVGIAQVHRGHLLFFVIRAFSNINYLSSSQQTKTTKQ